VTSPDYEVRLSREATNAFQAVPSRSRVAIRSALLRAATGGQIGKRGGKRIKTIKGARESFNRLRVGDYRVMYELMHEDRVLLVLGIVHRSELERWLRGK
jgi:mRNA-degrading endonuclease RelE of RelBE toxin-antitoxin system